MAKILVRLIPAEEPTRPARDYGERLAIAEHDLLTNWKTYRTRMELKHR